MRDLVPWPGMEPGPPALETQTLSHWTTREVPVYLLLCFFPFCTFFLEMSSVLSFNSSVGFSSSPLSFLISKNPFLFSCSLCFLCSHSSLICLSLPFMWLVFFNCLLTLDVSLHSRLKLQNTAWELSVHGLESSEAGRLYFRVIQPRAAINGEP